MEAILLPALITTASVYIVLWQLDIYKVVGYHLAFDISFTLLLSILFAGTYAGVLVAMLAGLMISVLLLITKWLIGYKRIVGWKYFKPIWRYYPTEAHEAEERDHA